jgi:hypothetical protein
MSRIDRGEGGREELAQSEGVVQPSMHDQAKSRCSERARTKYKEKVRIKRHKKKEKGNRT